MTKQTRKPIRYLLRLLRLAFIDQNQTAKLTQQSYNQISCGYDESWTNHMRQQTNEMINQLGEIDSKKCLDLTCGTGYATNLLCDLSGRKTTGVDISKGMLNVARENYKDTCFFVEDDILNFLRKQPNDSFDVITCCWGLGYSKPFAVIREIKRVLCAGGKIGIIDNSLFSLREIIFCSFLTFLEYPSKLENLMKVNFLSSKSHLNILLKLAGFKTTMLYKGEKSYCATSARAVIDRLHSTGAAAGFEHSTNTQNRELIDSRFAEILENKYLKNDSINITHRFIAGVGVKR